MMDVDGSVESSNGDSSRSSESSQSRAAVPGASRLEPALQAKVAAMFGATAPLHRRNRSISPVAVEDRLSVCEFLRNHTCYDLLPLSYKVIIFDTSLQVKKAFYAMLQNEIRAAPLWDGTAESIVGMLTVTDFINILRHYHLFPNETHGVALQDHQIQTWRDMDFSLSLPEGSPSKPYKQLFCVSPMQSLLDAASILIANRIHRVPLIDRLGPESSSPASEMQSAQECCVAVITQFKILRFIATNFKARQSFLRQSIADLGIGTFANIATATLDTPLIHVLNIFTDLRISCVPIVDQDGVVVDVYEKFDVTYLARDGAYNDLNMPVREALQHRIEEIFEGVHTCTIDESLGSIFTTIKHQLVHRLIVVDADKKLKGIVSVSDILSFLLV